jgi:hypothetical protein
MNVSNMYFYSEVASIALFLASGNIQESFPTPTAQLVYRPFPDDSSYVNGQNWAVDGGLSGSHPVVPGKVA